MPMKRFFLVFCSSAALFLAVYLLVFHSQKDKEPLGKITQEAVRLVHNRSMLSAATKLLNTSLFHGLANVDQSTLPPLLSIFFTKQVQQVAQSLAPQELIPRHAMAVLDLSNAAQTGKGFLDSRFSQTLNTIDWSTVLQRVKIKRSLRQPVELNASGLMHLLTHPSFSQAFAHRLFLVQLPALPSLLSDKQQHPFLGNLLFIMDPGQEAPQKIIDLLLEMFQGEYTELKYVGLTIHSFKSRQRLRLYITTVGGKVILSFAQQPMQQSIDLFLGHFFQRQKNLLQNQEYRQLDEERPEQTDFFFYADLFRLKLYFSLLSAQFSSQNKREEESITRPWAPGVRSMGFYHHKEENIDQFKTVVRFSQDQLYPFQRYIYTTPPIPSQSFQEVPDDLLVSFWFNWLEPQLWWQTTIAHGKKDELESANRTTAWIKEKTGMSMEQFLGLFGKNLSVHVADISTAGFFPVPRLCVAIEVLNRKKIDAFLQAIIANLPVRRTMINGVPVVSLMAAQGMLQPSYAFFNGYLLIADSREQIEDILLKKKPLLADSKSFLAVDTHQEQPANLHLYARIPEMMNALQELASWAGTMIAVRDHRAGSTSKLLVDQLISPVLDSFTTYSAIGIRSTTAPNELVLDAKVLRAKPASP